MPGNGETSSRSFGTAKFALKVQGASIEVTAQLPEGLVKPAALLPVLQNLSDSMTELTVRRANQLGETLSCREGCDACCHQAVPITPVEARMLAEWLEELPEERQTRLRERFRNAAAKLEESGIAQAVREASPEAGRGAVHALGLKYFALGIPCPFLEQERCTIREMRPLRCREHLVVSPAGHCAHPQTREIVGIKPPVLLSQILARWNTSGDEQPQRLILLTMLEEWVAKHPATEDMAHRTSPELLQEFLRKFARDAAAAPADPRGTADEAEGL